MRTRPCGRPPRVARAVLAALLAGCGGGGAPEPGVVRVAVAANFAATHAELAALFEARTGYRVEASTGSSGQLYAQIRNGAPFHLFLSADEERPAALEREGRTVPGTRFTYARGRLALYAPELDPAGSEPAEVLARVRHLAVANPETAPYGRAALEALASLRLLERARDRLVRAESVAQVLQFVSTGAAEAGFLALAQLQGEPAERSWLVPGTLHAPILQQGVLLPQGKAHEGARAFLAFLAGEEAAGVIRAHGYGPSREEAGGEGAAGGVPPPRDERSVAGVRGGAR